MLLGFVLYAHWDGGRVGDSLAKGLAWLIGEARLGVPVALAAAGFAAWVRPLLANLKPLRAGALLLFASATLALAGGHPAHGFWSAAAFRANGGVLGQAELWVASRLIGATGAHILAVFLALAGVVLVSGGSLAVAVRRAGVTLRTDRTRAPQRPPAPRRAHRAARAAAPRACRARNARRSAGR